MLKLYPDQTNPAVLRAGADVLVVAWCALWIVIGSLAHRLVESLQSVVDGLQSSGEAIKAVLGPFERGPLNRLVGNVLPPDLGDRVVAFAGRSHTAIDNVALATAVATAAVPIVLLLVPYLMWRWRDARKMGAALSFVRSTSGTGEIEQARAILAIRAVSSLPFQRLMRVSKDPAADLRAQHHEALAAEMMRSLGLNPSRLQTLHAERSACPSREDRVDT
jgi:hypothetical protein